MMYQLYERYQGKTKWNSRGEFMNDRKLMFNLFDKIWFTNNNYFAESTIERISIESDGVTYYTNTRSFTNDDIGVTIFSSLENAKAKKENAVSLDEKAAKALECVENLKAWIPTAEDRVKDEDTYRCIQEVKDIVNGDVENYSFAKKESKIPRPDEKATIVLHSIDKDEFEIIDTTFHNEEQNQLMEQVSAFQSEGNEVPDNIYRKLCAIDGLQKMVAEDLGNYGEVAKYIHQKLWKENGEEYYYTIDVEVGYTEDRDYWTGEVDYDVDFDYHVTEISKEYEEEKEEEEKEEERGI